MMRCLDCGLELEHDDEAEMWTNRMVLIAYDMVDIGVNGQYCRATEGGELHRPDHVEEKV